MRSLIDTLVVLCFLSRSLPLTVLASIYHIEDTYIGEAFYTGFVHEAIDDPTHGRVKYITEEESRSLGLTKATHNAFIMKADNTTVLDPEGEGRKSVRLLSRKQYSTSVTIFNLRHMPAGCGTWPAFWTTSATVNWPEAGEIDILEGVNDVSPNHATLHTLPGCTMSAETMDQTGTLTSTDCNAFVNYNQGCSVAADKPITYGPELNAVGGGWFAMERTESTISVWFWTRDEFVPVDVKLGLPEVIPATWGRPFANFVSDNCNISEKFGPNNIIINLTFCGDWAGNVYPSTCPLTCVDHVNQNPSAFTDAYWDIASLRVYEPISLSHSSHKKRHFKGHRALKRHSNLSG